MIRVNMGVENQQLKYILSIQYLVKFKKDNIEVQALLDSVNKVNAINLAYVAKLRLYICFNNIKA